VHVALWSVQQPALDSELGRSHANDVALRLGLRAEDRLWHVGPDGFEHARAVESERARGPRRMSWEELGATRQPLLVVEAGTTPCSGWIDGLLAHSKRAGPSGVVALSTNAAPAGEVWPPLAEDSTPARWLEGMARLHRLWQAGVEDVEESTSPVLTVLAPHRHVAALRAWSVAGGTQALELGPEARLIVARDLAAWRDPCADPQRVLRARACDPDAPDIQRLQSLPELRRVQAALAGLLDAGPRPHARLRLAELCNLTGQHTRAQEHARACLEHWRDHLLATLCLAEALAHSGHAQRARVLLEQVSERAPVTPHVRARLLACLGETWRRSGDVTQAEECFGAALLLDPGQVIAINGRAQLSMEDGDFDSATRALLTAAQAEPLRADTWSNLGRSLVLSGANEQGSSMLALALSINPTHRDSRVLLERVGLLRLHRKRACG
jgi:Flp pilus assembly protein TadD